MTTLSPDVEHILKLGEADPTKCVRCREPADVQATIVLGDAAGQPTGDVREVSLCLVCGADLLASPSARFIKFGDA